MSRTGETRASTLFTSAQRGAGEWQALPEAKKAQWRAKAIARNKLAKGKLLAVTEPAASGLAGDGACDPDPPCGPWNIASLSGKYPLHVSVIEAMQQATNMPGHEAQWNAKWAPKIKAAAGFPSTMPFDGPTTAETPEHLQAVVAEMLKLVRFSLKYDVGAGQSDLPDSSLGVLFEFRDGAERQYGLVSHCQSLDKEEFEAEFLRMRPIGECDLAELPVLSFVGDVGPSKQQLFDIATERDFVLSLVHGQAEPHMWELHKLSWTVLIVEPRAWGWRQAVS